MCTCCMLRVDKQKKPSLNSRMTDAHRVPDSPTSFVRLNSCMHDIMSMHNNSGCRHSIDKLLTISQMHSSDHMRLAHKWAFI